MAMMPVRNTAPMMFREALKVNGPMSLEAVVCATNANPHKMAVISRSIGPLAFKVPPGRVHADAKAALT